jgi:hypothetical protein
VLLVVMLGGFFDPTSVERDSRLLCGDQRCSLCVDAVLYAMPF